MKRFIRNAIILFLPLLFIVLVNESIRPTIEDQLYTAGGIIAINSAEYLPTKCSWVCHNNTTYCKIHHVKFLKPYYAVTDVFYNGVIGMLASTGNYVGANIFFLVFLFPLMIVYFIIKSINIKDEIRKKLK